jgi:hypothetical protein
MLGVDRTDAIDDRRIVLFGVSGSLLHHLGWNLGGCFRCNGRTACCGRRQVDAGRFCQLREHAGRGRIGKQGVENVRALVAIGVAEKLADHLCKRRCLLGAKHGRESVGQARCRRSLCDLIKVRANFMRSDSGIFLRIILQNIRDLVHPAHAGKLKEKVKRRKKVRRRDDQSSCHGLSAYGITGEA